MYLECANVKDLCLVAISFVSRPDVQRVSRPWLLQPEKEPVVIACPKLAIQSGTKINDPTPYCYLIGSN